MDSIYYLQLKLYLNLNVAAHLVIPAVWGSCLPRLAIFDDCPAFFQLYSIFQIADVSYKWKEIESFQAHFQPHRAVIRSVDHQKNFPS